MRFYADTEMSFLSTSNPLFDLIDGDLPCTPTSENSMYKPKKYIIVWVWVSYCQWCHIILEIANNLIKTDVLLFTPSHHDV